MSDSNLPGNAGSTHERALTLAGFWLASWLYGLYAVMFMTAMSVSLKNMRKGVAFSKMMLGSMVLMFIMTTLFNGINVHRGIQAFALTADAQPMAASYYHDVSRWDNFAFPVIVMMLTWHTEALMIYRCFVIWSSNFWVIIIPSLLLVFNFAMGTVFLTWSKNPTTISRGTASTILDMTYALNFSLSMITTALIAYKVYSKHRRAQANGILRVSSGVNLLTVVRIVIESALIFTVQQLILLILSRVKSPVQVIFHVTTIPITGIVFALMVLRTHFAQTNSELQGGKGQHLSHTTSNHRPVHPSINVITTRTVHEDLPMQALDRKPKAGDVPDDSSRVESYEALERPKRG